MTDKPNQMAERARQLIWLERAVAMLDDRFRIPGTRIRFGVESIIGLIPWLGDMVGFAISGMLVMVMVRNGASGMVVVRMIWNIALDATIGAIPLIGDIFDVGFKANRRNLRLLTEYYEEGKHQGSARWIIITVFIVLFALLVGLTILSVWMIGWILSGLGI